MAAPVITAATEGSALSGGAASAASEAAGAESLSGAGVESSASSGVGNVISGASSIAGEGLSPITNIVGMVQARRSREEAARQFDATFAENQRRWGLEFALREWATRKGVAMDEARALFERQQAKLQGELATATTKSALASEALQRRQSGEQFQWLKDDRKKTRKMNQAFSTGLIKGLMGGGTSG